MGRRRGGLRNAFPSHARARSKQSSREVPLVDDGLSALTSSGTTSSVICGMLPKQGGNAVGECVFLTRVRLQPSPHGSAPFVDRALRCHVHAVPRALPTGLQQRGDRIHERGRVSVLWPGGSPGPLPCRTRPWPGPCLGHVDQVRGQPHSGQPIQHSLRQYQRRAVHALRKSVRLDSVYEVRLP